ncbi:hypothetical protein [Vibrio anguillarum]|uniref:hypothetical protein n=1 Tax=Vibrio anguillarum TaxID=55601 RepID=UPI000BB4D4BA|nr:hypothetical protein [Vibrio anguillarum]ATC58459.1 hypothetical protein CMV05_13085 [Vibrio anguillarum]MBF4218124.1 hypothetical protein [Vibrio anguillarum]MBF4253057.1 hypothetical protein [Vibrio anguillarum]MBF4389913.1 hypothetical protein [Vibrio anguillarum]MBF4404744.1 hypothetical protein [Vibrio anguillarum]
MKKVNKFEDVSALPIPNGIKAKLLEHLIEPFGDEKSTSEVWEEINTCLYLIEEGDTDKSLSEESEQVHHLLRFAINYSEFVLQLDDECPWLLALAIITSDGGGIYLVAPMNSPTFPVVKLANQVES